MRTRNIRIRTESVDDQRRRQLEIKNTLKERFKKDINEVDAFIDRMLSTGWTAEDFDSAIMQSSNKYRPPMEVSLFFHQKLLDYLHIQQARHTCGQDTAINPNYAVRHKGQWESMMRRFAFSDGLLTAAAHSLTATTHSIDESRYWQLMWASFHDLFLDGDTSIPVNKMLQSPSLSLAYAYKYAAYGVNTDIYEGNNVHAIHELFFNPINRYEYLRMSIEPKRSREREGSIYVNKHYSLITFDCDVSNDEKNELISKGTLMLLCLAFDKFVEDYNEHEGPRAGYNPIEHFTRYVERTDEPVVRMEQHDATKTRW